MMIIIDTVKTSCYFPNVGKRKLLFFFFFFFFVVSFCYSSHTRTHRTKGRTGSQRERDRETDIFLLHKLMTKFYLINPLAIDRLNEYVTETFCTNTVFFLHLDHNDVV